MSSHRMDRRRCLRTIRHRAVLLCLFLLTGWCSPAGEIHRSTTEKFEGGTLTVYWKGDTPSKRLLLHFHGAPDTVQTAYERSGIPHTVATLNFNGLSAAYSGPFQKDSELYQRLLSKIADVTFPQQSESSTIQSDKTWEGITLSCFSAGYGAVREILRNHDRWSQLDGVIAADSIYAGLDSESPRRVSREHMQDFLSFAKLAVQGQKVFLVSHSSLSTPYGSTVETADYLLSELMIQRTPEDIEVAPGFRRLTLASQVGFEVQGYAGEAGPDHMQHLRRIDLFWSRAEQLRTSTAKP